VSHEPPANPAVGRLLGTLAALGLVGLGRATAAGPATAEARGYHDGALAGYDGGWSLGEPYVIMLARGGNGITYRIASRTPCPEASSTTDAGSRPITGLLACQTGR
jgi:hypothetical protein